MIRFPNRFHASETPDADQIIARYNREEEDEEIVLVRTPESEKSEKS